MATKTQHRQANKYFKKKKKERKKEKLLTRERVLGHKYTLLNFQLLEFKVY